MLHWPTGADIDHDVMVGQFQSQALAEDMEADAMAPIEEAGGGKVADRTIGETQACRTGGGDIETRELLAVLVPSKAENLGHVAGKIARQIDNMGGLLDHLAAGLVLMPPPLRRRSRVQPIAGQQLRRAVGEA